MPVQDRPVGARASRVDAIAGAGLLSVGAVLTAGVVSPRVRAAVQDIEDRWYRSTRRSRWRPQRR
jgi:hypothetical protein